MMMVMMMVNNTKVKPHQNINKNENKQTTNKQNKLQRTINVNFY